MQIICNTAWPCIVGSPATTDISVLSDIGRILIALAKECFNPVIIKTGVEHMVNVCSSVQAFKPPLLDGYNKPEV